MKQYFTIGIMTIAALCMYSVGVHHLFAQNVTGTQDNGCPKHGFGSDADFCADFSKQSKQDRDCFKSNADFCGGAAYIPNPHKNNNNNQNNHKFATILVSYGDVSGYKGKGVVVIKNAETGKTLVWHKLNFAKQYANQGDNCCAKTYKFDKTGTHVGDKITIKVTGGGGSWEDYDFYKKNFHMFITLDEIGE
jgi:hypothetical protein